MQNSHEFDENHRRPDWRGDRNPITVRTDPEHKWLFGELADLFGLSRNDFVAIVMAEACGLSRPKRSPAVPLAVHRLAEIVDAIRRNATPDELHDLAVEVLREGVLPKTA